MIKKKFRVSTVKIIGYIAFGLGVLAFLEEHVFKFSNYSHTYNPGYGLAVCALIFLGMACVAIANCLENIEKCLDNLESGKSTNT